MTQESDQRALVLAQEDKGMAKVSGAKPLKKLNAKHRLVIALILQGYSNNDVARITGLTPSRVSIIRHDPLVEKVLDRHFEDTDHQLAALGGKAVDAVKRGLESADHKAALRASEIYFKTQGKFKETEAKDKNVTAEDVARQVIEVQGSARITLERGTKISTNSADDEDG